MLKLFKYCHPGIRYSPMHISIGTDLKSISYIHLKPELRLLFLGYIDVASSEYCFVAYNPTPTESATSKINLNILPSLAPV